MPSYGRLRNLLGGDSIDDLRPELVLRHDGDAKDFERRLHAAMHLAHRLGKPGIRKITPFIFKYVCNERNLKLAWDHLSKEGGYSPGPDGRCYSDFNESDTWHHLRQLRDLLKDGVYKPERCDEHVVDKSKGTGRGTRPLVLQNIEHRVVQRAVLQVVQPLLDPLFLPGVHGGRPGCGPWSALAAAEYHFAEAERTIWVTEDLRDAFSRVPLPRLLQIVKKYLRDDELVDLIARIVSNSKVPGLRQGGCLSPFLLNLYLHHLLDVVWRRSHPDIPLVRYLDDILLLCRSSAEAKRARRALEKLLAGTGMLLKDTGQTTIRTLTKKSPAEWLGFRIEKTGSKLVVNVAEPGWEDIKKELALDCGNEEQLVTRLGSWIQSFAPCFAKSNRAAAVDMLMPLIEEVGLADSLSSVDLRKVYCKAYKRWLDFRSTALERMSADADLIGGEIGTALGAIQ